MPTDPYDPSGDDPDDEHAPDLGDMIRRILDDDGDSGPTPASP